MIRLQIEIQVEWPESGAQSESPSPSAGEQLRAVEKVAELVEQLLAERESGRSTSITSGDPSEGA